MFRQYERLWKPGTLEKNRNYLKNQLLPHFAGRPVAEVDARELRGWFSALAATRVRATR